MARIAARIDVAVTPALCIHAIQESMTDERLLSAYKALRPGKQYSGFVTMLVPDRRMVIEFAGLEPATNKRSHRVGWRVSYEFSPAPDGMTRVEVAIEYGMMTALATGGLAGPQAENEIVGRLAALRMLEAGVTARGDGAPP